MALMTTTGVLDQILAHALRSHPIEACGMVVSHRGEMTASEAVPLRNLAASRVAFRFDPSEQLQVVRRLERQNKVCRAIYHSHTASQAYPSRQDLAYANDPEIHYVIVSTWGQALEPIRSFRLRHGTVTEETISVAGRSAHTAHCLFTHSLSEQTMSVVAIIPSLFQNLTANERKVYAQGSTVGQVIDHLESQFPGLKCKLVNDKTAHEFINIYVNERDIRFYDGLNTRTEPGDTLTILPAVAGG